MKKIVHRLSKFHYGVICGSRGKTWKTGSWKIITCKRCLKMRKV